MSVKKEFAVRRFFYLLLLIFLCATVVDVGSLLARNKRNASSGLIKKKKSKVKVGHRGRRKSKKRLLRLAAVTAEEESIKVEEKSELAPEVVEKEAAQEAQAAESVEQKKEVDPVPEVAEEKKEEEKSESAPESASEEKPADESQEAEKLEEKKEVAQKEPEAKKEKKEEEKSEPAPESAPEEKPAQEADKLEEKKSGPAPEVVEKEATEKDVMQEAKAAAPVEKKEEVELIGIDTIDIDEPAGNWLYKRIYWEKAEHRYEKVKALLEKIMDARMYFFDKQVELDKDVFDPFYLDIGIKGGRLDQVVNELITKVDDELKQQGSLDKQERDLLAKLQKERTMLEQLQHDVKGIKKVDEAISNSIKVLMNTINQARGFEKQAWQNFKMIARELSDKKAHKLYYGIETFWRNMKDIQDYITGQLRPYFDQLADKAQEQTKTVQSTMDELKEKGIDLKEQAEKLGQADEEVARKKTIDQTKEEIQKSVEAAGKAQKKKPGIWGRMIVSTGSFFSSLWGYTVSGVQASWYWVSSWFGAKKDVASVAPVTEQESEGTPEERDDQAEPEAVSVTE